DELYRTITKWIAFASAPVLMVLLTYPGEFIALLFGPQYLEGTNVLRVLVLGTFASILMGSAGGSLTSLGNNRVVLYTVTAAASLNVVLNVTLIPQLGIVGAGLATAISTAALALFQASVLFKLHDLIPLGRLGVRTMAVSGAIGVLLYAISSSNVVFTVVATVLWGVVHGLSIVFLGVNDRDKRIFVLIEDQLGVQIPFIRRLEIYQK
ncbi:MAG: polysaccharide biosynthesis C-terminal domain-containing protein, partial [Haloarculaceae archaeon]